MRKEIELAKIPHVLELNRIKRAYTGGKLLDEWQRLEHAEDGNMSEEFLISTVEVQTKIKYRRRLKPYHTSGRRKRDTRIIN